MHPFAKAFVEGFKEPFRIVRDLFTLKPISFEPVKIGYVDDSEMHGSVFAKIDDLREALEWFAAGTEKVVLVNRFYISGDDVSLNVTIDKEMYLITVLNEGYEVRRRNNKTSQPDKHRVDYEAIQDGSFLELFNK